MKTLILTSVVAAAATWVCIAAPPEKRTPVRPGTDTVEYFVSKSDTIVSGMCTTSGHAVNHVTGFTYFLRLVVGECLTPVRPSTNTVSVTHKFEKYTGELDQFFEGNKSPEPVRVIMFLKNTDRPSLYRTADPYFGIMPYSEHMEWQITKAVKKLAQNKSVDPISEAARDARGSRKGSQ